MDRCDRCQSAVCDGRTVMCLGCGVEQCHGNGLSRGACSVCLYGVLPGWSSWDKSCSYKGCNNLAAFHNVPGAVKCVCHEHATRPKITLHQHTVGRTTMAARKVSLAEYVRERLASDRWSSKGVVTPGQRTQRRPVYTSVEKEAAMQHCYEQATRLATSKE